MPKPNLVLHKTVFPEDFDPYEFKWDGRSFGLYGGTPYMSALDTITICYGSGGGLLELEPDEELKKIIVAWAAWARRRRAMLQNAQACREAMMVVNTQVHSENPDLCRGY